MSRPPPRYLAADTRESARISGIARSLAAGDQAKLFSSLYGFLDVLDRKAASFVTLNGILFAIGSLFVFKPLVDGTAADWSAPLTWLLLALGTFGVAGSAICVFVAVHIFSVRWAYMAHAVQTNGVWSFDAEERALACECARRTRYVGRMRELTLWAAVLILAAIPVHFLGPPPHAKPENSHSKR